MPFFKQKASIDWLVGMFNLQVLLVLKASNSIKLCQIVRTMFNNRIDLLPLFESRWRGHGTTSMQSYTILHSLSDSSHSVGCHCLISPCLSSLGSSRKYIFEPINGRIMYIRLKSHLSYITVFAIYASINPVTSTT